MKFTKTLLFLASIVVLAACGKNDAIDNDSKFECSLDGEQYEAKGLFAYATTFTTDNTIAIYGLRNNGDNTIYLSIPNEGQKKTYQLGLDKDGDGYVVLSKGTFITTLENGSGEVEVTKVNDKDIEGTFSFTAFDGNGAKVEVSGGEFKVNIRE
ncbi:MAG: DUF6252 family protein [Bacteroidota bacterium]